MTHDVDMIIRKSQSGPISTELPDIVAAVFESYSDRVKHHLLLLRQLILDTAAQTEGVGQVEETLRWGEPSYLTTETRSGSTIRIGMVRRSTNRYAVFFNCQTSLVSTFRQMYPDLFEFDGNRAIVFHEADEIPEAALAHCISLALRYHLDKRK